jgi:hypothetical protein
MRSPSTPEYTVYPDRITDTLIMYRASVYIRGGSAETHRNNRFVERAMPTERHAVQMAAHEAIAHLRDILSIMQTRPYQYLP